MKNKKAYIFLKNLKLWFIITSIFLASLVYAELSDILPENTLDIWKPSYDILSSLLIGVLSSFAFYYLVVYLPQSEKKRIIKAVFLRLYLSIKKSILAEIISTAISYDPECKPMFENIQIDDLLKHHKFRNVFEQDGSKAWYAFVNGMSGQDQECQKAITYNIRLLVKKIEYILSNYELKTEKDYDALHNLEIFLLDWINHKVEYGTDDYKIPARNIWDLFAGSYLYGSGPQDHDYIEKIIEEM
jgi:hypothetical protein